MAGAANSGNAQPVYRERNYYPPAPRPAYRRPHVVYADRGLEPWSPGWYRYCEDRYRSFNPSTGTFRGYDGRDHFCAAR
ncbi:BA14K family protein [Mesorhizobium xinjiangense]|uniref:BA14K family protein n=1 Tax=Mesorhizobium xinjiangense TaxID=2678685 RepID=UPI0038B2F22B